MEALTKIARDQIEQSIRPEYREKVEEEQGLGIALAHHYRWEGERIIRACFYALEDANFHTEAAVLWKMLPEGKQFDERCREYLCDEAGHNCDPTQDDKGVI